jgi:hypothetical protein
MHEISGLWINQTKEGKRYLSGNLNRTARILIFQNERKRPDSKDPDYYLFVDGKKKPDGSGTTD